MSFPVLIYCEICGASAEIQCTPAFGERSFDGYIPHEWALLDRDGCQVARCPQCREIQA